MMMVPRTIGVDLVKGPSPCSLPRRELDFRDDLLVLDHFLRLHVDDRKVPVRTDLDGSLSRIEAGQSGRILRGQQR